MYKVKRTALVPYSAPQMYALVADIEAYPDFLPWCRRVQVHHRDDARVRATMVFAAGPFHHSFTTENRIEPDRSIEVGLESGPFRHLHGFWRFDPVGDRGCRIALDMEFDFSNRVLGMTLGPVFNEISRQLVDAFTSRAARVYGKQRGAGQGRGGVRAS